MSMPQRVATYKPGSEGLLEPLLPWLDDKAVSEMLINQPGSLFIEKYGVMHRIAMPCLTTRYLKCLFQLIANENQQTLNQHKPILSGNLHDGSRVQLVIPPASKEYTLSIRRKTFQSVSFDDYKAAGFFEWADGIPLNLTKHFPISANEQTLDSLYQAKNWPLFIQRAIQDRKTLVISGGTSSGKTTFLNACLHHIDLNERLILMEDTYELDPPHENCVRLFAPKKIHADEKGVDMQTLLHCALRLRPDRILMGEIRGKEILDFIAACSTGHEGSLTSIHANDPELAFMRMTQLYKLNNVPSMTDQDILRELKAVIDIIIQITKVNGKRFISSVYYKGAVL